MTLSIGMRRKWIQLNFSDFALLGMGEGIRSLGLGSFRIPIEYFIEIFAGGRAVHSMHNMHTRVVVLDYYSTCTYNNYYLLFIYLT